MTQAQTVLMLEWWNSGLDTQQIGRLLNLPEHVIYNALARRRREKWIRAQEPTVANT